MSVQKPTLLEKNFYTFSWDNGVSVELHRLDDKGHAEIWTRHNNGTSKLIDVSELNLLASRSRDEFCKRLTPICNIPDFAWEDAFRWIVPMALNARRAGEPVIELGRSDAVITKPAWDCYPLVVSGMLNILFGNRGSLKSKLALFLAIGMSLKEVFRDKQLGLSGPNKNLNVLKLDYEATQDADEYEWRRILRGLDMEGALQLKYRACRRPLADDIEAISNHADAVKSDVLLIDSLGPAAGGNLNDSEPALRFGEAVRKLNRTVICPAHTSKNQLGIKTVYGNAFYENLARNIWEVSKEEDEDDESTVQHIALHQTKSPPFAPHHKDMAFQFDFDEESERIEVTKYDPNKMDIVNEKKGNPRKILESLKSDKLSITEISERTGIGKEVCKTTLYRLLKSQKVTKVGEDWGLKYNEQ
jgi:hypothetical protein